MTKTIENLKAAITGESTASATYAAYAAKAAQEGQPLIQKLFEAASKAESVHAANHNKVLEKLGATMEPIDIQIHVGPTAERAERRRPFLHVGHGSGKRTCRFLFRRPEGPGKRRYQFPAQAILDMPGLRRHVQISGRRGCVPPLRHQG